MSPLGAPAVDAGALVPGDPAELHAMAGAYAAAGSSLGRLARQLRSVPPDLVGSPGWSGVAATAAALAAGGLATAIDRAAGAMNQAAGACRAYAIALDDAQQAFARAASVRTLAATAQDAAERTIDEAAAGTPPPAAAVAALRRAGEELTAAARAAGGALEAARLAAAQAAGAFDGVAAQAAAIAATGTPTGFPPHGARPPVDTQGDRDGDGGLLDRARDALGWVGEQGVGVVRGFGEGVVGMGEGLVMLAKLHPQYAMADPVGYRKQAAEAGLAVQFAKENPKEFLKAVANWEDIEAGRYGEWLGNLGPDAVLAAVTWGSGAAATGAARGVRAADAMGDTAQAARDVARLADSRAALNRARQAKAMLPGTKANRPKTTAADGMPTLSGWAQPRPGGFAHATPEAVRDYARRIGHDLEPDPVADQTGRPDGFPGKYQASHAEKQQALTAPGHPIAVSKTMCPDCVEFFAKHAIHSRQPQIVTDPNGTRLFNPDGRVIMNPGPDDFPTPTKLPTDANEAHLVGAGAGITSETLDAGSRVSDAAASSRR
jgi:hypothetical protein